MAFWLLVALLAAVFALISNRDLARRLNTAEQRLRAVEQKVAAEHRADSASLREYELPPSARKGLSPEPSRPSQPASPTSAVAKASITSSSTTSAESAQAQADNWRAPVAARSHTSDWSRVTSGAGTPTLDWLSPVMERIKRYFTEGNVIVRVGVIVLFFGVAFLLRYAQQQVAVPMQMKLSAVGALGAALLAVGWHLRHSRRAYALILQGGGVGILYITVFAALRLFDLLSPTVGFGLLLVMVALAAAAAVLQNARSLAVMAVTGGFLAPILTATEPGSHIVLFSYYAVLNLGILAIAWAKSWRELNVLGFLFTFVIGTVWGVLSYSAVHVLSAQAFLILFFLFYVLIALLFARRQPVELKGYVDGTLVFGTPLVGFGLQAGLMQPYDFGLAWSALVLGGFYTGLVWLCRRYGGSAYRLLSEAFLALAVVFFSLTIPFALEGEWIALAWALEGAAILWVSLKQKRQMGVAFALLLQLGAGLLFLPDLWLRSSAWPGVNAVFLGGAFVALAGLYSSYALTRAGDWLIPSLRSLAPVMLLWGLGWWLTNGVLELVEFAPSGYRWGSLLCLFAVTAAALGAAEAKLNWQQLRYTPVVLFGLMVLLSIASIQGFEHPLSDFGLVGWPALFAALYGLLYLQDKIHHLPAKVLATLHAGAWWLVALIFGVEFYWLVESRYELGGSWPVVAQVPLLLAMLWIALKGGAWPWRPHRPTYTTLGSWPIVGFFVLWSLFVSTSSSGDFSPLPYLPTINPLDITQILVLLTLAYWVQDGYRDSSGPVALFHGHALLGALTFVWLTAVLLRTLHHWAEIDYHWTTLWDSHLVQAAVSVFWTLVGLVTMYFAARFKARPVWIAAATLLGLTVAKLFLLDMRDNDTLETIVAFLAVGILLLVVGYLSPMPPGKASDALEAKVAP
ncbi:DUF2339 domain-containing protein [Marinimicrobium sp. ABcell2]|uniref:DUF2339 domain-containing protein n=1 Tax=Marinimicrobium sp. ABcell2 TaxID=3069751 RepID=UPI0027B2284E|nr:DUF2339 domain-containing protein [Marinimicrobium sp. ABcell2]MDQ2076109.1 DUF2339 domain-containing protein [Marinimicrobium sp. ABcell2]